MCHALRTRHTGIQSVFRRLKQRERVWTSIEFISSAKASVISVTVIENLRKMWTTVVRNSCGKLFIIKNWIIHWIVQFKSFQWRSHHGIISYPNLFPRVSHLTAPGGGKMRDPGNEVAHIQRELLQLPSFKPWRSRYESVNYGISNYWFT